MLWDPFLYCINDSIQGKSETDNKVFVLPSKVSINTDIRQMKSSASLHTITDFISGYHITLLSFDII